MVYQNHHKFGNYYFQFIKEILYFNHFTIIYIIYFYQVMFFLLLMVLYSIIV